MISRGVFAAVDNRFVDNASDLQHRFGIDFSKIPIVHQKLNIQFMVGTISGQVLPDVFEEVTVDEGRQRRPNMASRSSW